MYVCMDLWIYVRIYLWIYGSIEKGNSGYGILYSFMYVFSIFYSLALFMMGGTVCGERVSTSCKMLIF